MNASEALLADDSLRAPHAESAERIRKSGARMEKMIGDLLDFTRTRLGTGLPVDPADCDLGRIVRGVAEELRAHYPRAAIACRVSGELRGAWDIARVEQMLSNLVQNAVQYGREGSPVTVTAAADEAHASVAIHNEGAAIPEDEQKVIFDPLQRAAAAGRRRQDCSAGEGSGLGLYIARKIAEAHGGSIDVASSEEDGTTFTVRLPRLAGSVRGAACSA